MKTYGIAVLLLSLVLCAAACAPSADSPAATAPDSSTSGETPVEPTAPQQFWIEPNSKTILGRGQTMNLFSAYKAKTSDAFPEYVDPAKVKFTVSNSAIVTVDAKGLISGVADGSAIVTASYLGFTSQLTVQVTGSLVRRTVAVAGQGSRSYLLYVPNSTGAPALPLVLSLHGGGGSAMGQAATSLLNSTASAQGFLVAYPEGSGAIQTFNGGACCGYAQSHAIDDVLAMRAIINDIRRNYSVPTNAIFAAGFSNGSIMSHRLACEMSDVISGIAAFSGGSGEFDSNMARYYTCAPTRPIRIIHFHAANDRNYPIAGGNGDGSSATPFYSISSTISDWLARNNLSTRSATDTPAPRVSCVRYETPLRTDLPFAPVVLCTSSPIDVYDPISDIVFGGGHSWPGGVRGNSAASDVPSTFKANDYLWTFLTK